MEIAAEMIYSKQPKINIEINKCFYNYNCIEAVMNKEDFELLNAYDGYHIELINRLKNKKFINPLAEIQDKINK
jgi:hypothetical protein